MKIRKTALFGVLGALAVVLSFLEMMLLPEFPFLPPGVKLGLSNIVTMFTATFSGFGGAMYITLLKSGFVFVSRGATAFFMSFFGGFFSSVVLCILLKMPKLFFSFSGIGILCAVVHNIAQLVVSCIVTGTGSLLYYAPFLLLSALITGFFTGTVLKYTVPSLQKVLPTDFIIKKKGEQEKDD